MIIFTYRKDTMKIHTTLRNLSIGICATLSIMAVNAQTTTIGKAPPEGRLLACKCFQCHGTNGKGPGFDKLAGKSSTEIYKDLKEFQSGKEGNGIMAKHANGYTDAQMLSLSKWLTTQK